MGIKVNIIFDLDGTLIDSKPRLYKLFQDLVPESSLSYDDYWNLKKNKISNQDILKKYFTYQDDMVCKFMKNWMELIETPEYLKLDKNFDGIHAFIESKLLDLNLYVCSDRQFIEPVTLQLKDLGLLKFFKKTLVTEQKTTKQDLILTEVGDLSPSDWIIGDTGKDIQIGQELKIKTCAVLSGFLNYEALLPYNSNKIINSVLDFNL